MSDISLMHYFMGMEVWQEEGHMYVAKILNRFQMEDYRLMSTPMVTISTSDS
jgi:hypothetical protein